MTFDFDFNSMNFLLKNSRTSFVVNKNVVDTLIADIVVVEIFVVDYINRLTTAHIVANYTLIKNIIIVNTQTADNVINIKIIDIVSINILKSNRNEN